ncbi:MAG: hypothetical protein K0S53_2660 [Bacteroidetes bacterium]|jgi:hypothetical protein|nr:hypothetical protein [Bacteroidota bacterium]
MNAKKFLTPKRQDCMCKLYNNACIIYMYSLFQKIPFFVRKLQKLVIYICLILFSARCAQITPLTGGRKDMTSPKPIAYSPENASVNFNSRTISVEFDEYIALKDVANQFIITPQTKEMPEIQVAGKKLKITFSETLLPNTTYKLAFGNAITDLNEANVLQNFEYIFSTGSSIDSLKLSGRILNAIDQKPAVQVLVGLYNTNTADSVIYKDKPLYISKTDAEGNFRFNYLPGASFKIIGISDQNKNLLYDGSEEQIAFEKDYVKAGDSTSIALNLFKEIPSRSFIKKSFSPEYGKVNIIYNKPHSDIKDVVAKGMIDYKQNRLKDTLTIYYQNWFDTLQTVVSYESRKADTLQIKLINKTSFEKRLKNKEIRYVLQTNLTSMFPFYEMPVINLNVPMNSDNLLEDKITLIEKSDSTSKKLPVTILKNTGWITSFKIKADLKPEMAYALTINKNAFASDDQRSNDSVIYQFKTTAIEDHAQLKMKLFFPRKENYIIRLLNDKEQIVDERSVEFSLASTSEKLIEYKNLFPGNYFIRIVEDANKNGHFDTGDYFSKQQPEIIFVNASPIKLLAGWEIENEWIVK